MPSNTAAWLIADKATPLEIKEAPYTSPSENEIAIKNRAVAINPVDYAIQLRGQSLFSHLKYPLILGFDVAGEVLEIGHGVTRFKVGDRVVGAAAGSLGNTAEGGFQEYVVLQTSLTSPIPTSLSYETAVVLPLGLCTAACGLFMQDYLALQYPTVPAKSSGQSILIWGGSTSVGSNAIQLSVAAGYDVVTTCSPKNFEYVKKLGASEAFDYNSSTVVQDIIEQFKGKTVAGAFAIGSVTAISSGNPFVQACCEIVAKSEGKKFVSVAGPVPKDVPEGIEAKFVIGDSLKKNNLGKFIWEDFLPKALADGKYFAAPEAEVVGNGLESLQGAFELLKKGVSAKKVVVSLQ